MKMTKIMAIRSFIPAKEGEIRILAGRYLTKN
jgi:hypothetical protein